MLSRGLVLEKLFSIFLIIRGSLIQIWILKDGFNFRRKEEKRKEEEDKIIQQKEAEKQKIEAARLKLTRSPGQTISEIMAKSLSLSNQLLSLADPDMDGDQKNKDLLMGRLWGFIRAMPDANLPDL